jgi:membrane protease YdiL (CAAX protease family)
MKYSKQILDITIKFIVAISMAFIFYFGPVWVARLFFSREFRQSCDVFTRNIILGSISILLVIMMMVIIRKNLTMQNFFQKIELKSIFLIMLYGFTLKGILVSIGQLYERSVYSPYADLSFSNMIIFGLVVAPIIEELAFRGVIQTYLRSLSIYRVRIFWIYLSFPVLLSAILFSLIHVNLYTQYRAGGLFGTLLYTFMGGLYLSYYFEKTRNIFVPIVGHFTLNLSAVIWGGVFHYVLSL